MLFGNVVFSGDACAILREYRRGHSESVPHILFVSALTIDVAFYILENSVCGIITEESSFATHGANILRCHFNKSQNCVVWVSGVQRLDCENIFNKKVQITSDGAINVFDNSECVDFVALNEKVSVSYVSLNKRSILRYNISKDSYAICYWPHRKFDTLTFSIMQRGLRKNLSLLGFENATISLDNNGNIWFNQAPLLSKVVDWAIDSETALPILHKQIDLYAELYRRAQSAFNVSDLAEMLIEYFSVFILFHDTYEDVLIAANTFFRSHIENETVYQIMNLLMCCRIDEWLLNNSIVLEKNKKLLSYEKVVPLPEFSIISDIEYCLSRFADYLIDIKLEEFWEQHKQQIEFYIKFFVAKEWKFVMNKILFSRFAYCMSEQFPDISYDELSLKGITEIINLTKENQ